MHRFKGKGHSQCLSLGRTFQFNRQALPDTELLKVMIKFMLFSHILRILITDDMEKRNSTDIEMAFSETRLTADLLNYHYY